MSILIFVYIFIGVIVAGYLSLGLVNNTIYDIMLNMISFIGVILLWPVLLLVMVLYSR